MEYIGHFLHAWLMFAAPLIHFGYKIEFKKQALCTILYGIGIILFREMYNFLPVPFGTHVILLVILHSILLITILGKADWIKAMVASLMSFIVILINDSIILIPAMKYLNITVDGIGKSKVFTYIILWTLSNSLLIVSYMLGTIKFQKKQSYKF